MLVRRKAPIEGSHNLDRWLLTYADMITLLTAFFLMLYSMSVMSRGKFSLLATSVRNGFNGPATGGRGILPGDGKPVGETGSGRQAQYDSAMRDLRQFVDTGRLGEQVRFRADERGLVISLITDNLLFQRGTADIRSQSNPILAKVADVLKNAPNQVQIEGHTCDLPIRTSQFPSNWELSSARAGAILRNFTEQNRLPATRFVASGYADTHPLRPNTNEAARAQNRRVDIVILKSDAQKEADLLRRSEVRRIKAPQSPAPPENLP